MYRISELCVYINDCFCLLSKLYGDQARFFEAEKMPRIKHKKKGTVSMVNNGNEQHGSQVLTDVVRTALLIPVRFVIK